MRREGVTLLAGGLLLALSLVAIFWLNGGELITTLAFAAGVIVVVGSLYRFVEIRGREDERVKKVVAFAALNAWLTTMLLLMGLVALAYLDCLEHMSPMRLLALIALIMLAVFAGWYVYYSIRGDVE